MRRLATPDDFLLCYSPLVSVTQLPKRTDTNPGQKQSELTYEKVLQTFGVKRAFDTLVRKKVDPEFLKYWLHDIAIAPDKYGKRKDDKRKADQLVRSARNLATKIERAAKSPPMSFVGSRADLDAMLALRIELLPGRLRGYASYWEKLIDWENRTSRRRPRGPQSPRTDRIWALLEIIRECTGSYHYREVADLLNVMDMAYRRGKLDTHWDAENRSQLNYRARNRMAKALKH